MPDNHLGDSNHVTPAKNSFDAVQSLKVLIADDDITNRLVLQGILNKQGYITFHAENGQESVDIFKRVNPDLVLMDIMMPVMDGYEATSLIKENCGDQFVPVIFLTAMTDENALAQCIESGGDDFITKPYNHIILKARMEALLRIRELYNTIKSQRNEIALHQHRMEREQKVAETLFTNITRSGSLDKPFIKYSLSPMSLFSGDMLVSAEKPSGGVHVMLGDFTGHGLAAATGALPASAIFYEMTEKGYSIAEIVTELNTKMKQILPIGMFLAACVIDMNPESRSVAIWNGGIPDVIVLPTNTDVLRKSVSQNLPLGILGGDEFTPNIEVMDVSDGDRFYIYSHGVTETSNHDEEMYGQERLYSLFAKGINADHLFDEILADLAAYRGTRDQHDDVTLAELRFDERALSDCEHLRETQESIKHPASHWSINLHLQADVLRTADPLPIIIQSVCEVQGLYRRRQQLYTILGELYSNSLEHGLLGLESKMKETAEGFAEYYQERALRLEKLQSGSIQISAIHQANGSGGRLTLRVEDSGPGFDYTNRPNDMKVNVGHSGRGVPLLYTLCESVQYSGRGNVVEVVYDWE